MKMHEPRWSQRLRVRNGRVSAEHAVGCSCGPYRSDWVVDKETAVNAWEDHARSFARRKRKK